jgi:hypothetical protein
MSRYSTSATKVGSTHVALGFLMGLVSLDLGLTTVSSCFLIWLDCLGPAGPDLAHINQVLAFLLSEIERGDARWIFDEADDREFSLLNCFDFQPSLVTVGAVGWPSLLLRRTTEREIMRQNKVERVRNKLRPDPGTVRKGPPLRTPWTLSDGPLCRATTTKPLRASSRISGTSGNVPELCRRLEDTGHMLRRPQRVPPLGAGAVLFLRKAKRNADVVRQLDEMIGDKKGE